MTITQINPEQLHDTPGYHHITVAESGRLAFLAGQCPLDRAGQVVGLNDVLAQVDQVAANVGLALAAVAAEPGHVVRSVIYVVTDDRAVLSAVWQRFTESASVDVKTEGVAPTRRRRTRRGFARTGRPR